MDAKIVAPNGDQLPFVLKIDMLVIVVTTSRDEKSIIQNVGWVSEIEEDNIILTHKKINKDYYDCTYIDMERIREVVLLEY